MQNVNSKNVKRIVIVLGILLIVSILVGLIIIFYKIGGFTSVNEMLFFIKRKIMFVVYKFL